MTHGGILASGAGIVLAALLLSGCATTPTPSTSESPSASSVTGPTPSATPTAASKPGSRVPLGCSDLLDADTRGAIAGAEAKADQDENSHPTDLASVAQLQFGVLTCVWDGLDSSKGSELTISVSPNSAKEFDSRFSTIMAPDTSKHPDATLDVAGERSGFWCANDLEALGADFNLVICDGEMLVSGYWVGIQVDTVLGLTRAQLTTGITAAMKQIATKLSAAGPAAAQWTAPATTPPDLCTSSTSTAKVQSIVGASSLTRHSIPSPALLASTIGQQGTTAGCYWTPGSGRADVVLKMLAGGSWAFGTLKPRPIGDSDIRGPYARATIPGASDALIACGGSGCDAYLAIGTTAVEILTDRGLAASKTELAGLARLIAAS